MKELEEVFRQKVTMENKRRELSHIEDRLQTSILLKKLERKEPKLARELSIHIRRIIKHQDEKIKELQGELGLARSVNHGE